MKVNLQRSVYAAVDFAAHSHILESQILDKLENLFPAGFAQMWGIKPGQKPTSNPSVRSHQALRPGAKVFFVGNKHIYLSGTVELAWTSEPLAKEIWGEHEGQTWQYMYALSEVHELKIPMSTVRDELNWNPQRNVRQFTKLTPDEQRKLFPLLPFEEELESIDAPPTTKSKQREHYSGVLSRQRIHMTRGEQDELRRHILTGPSTTCALCGRDFPSRFIVAAHIKMRSRCTEAEMRNPSVVMPACRFGCDELYEHGYITVTPWGSIAVSPLVAKSKVISKYVHENLAHREIDWLNEQNGELFLWHYCNRYLGVPDESPTPVNKLSLGSQVTYSFEHANNQPTAHRAADN